MAWSPEVPPPPVRPVVTGWFAIFNVVSLQTVSMTNLANVIGALAALQNVPVTSVATAKGLQTAVQTMPMTDKGLVTVSPVTAQSFTLTESAALRGAPGAVNPLIMSESGRSVGVVLSPQQLALLNSGVVTGSEATVTAPDFIPVVDAATVRGMQTAGQSFTFVNAAALRGSQAASEVMTLTESGASKGVPAGSVTIAMSDSGTAYAVIAAPQSFGISNAATAYQVTSSGIAYNNSVAGPFYNTVDNPSPTHTHTHAANCYAIVHISYGWGFNSMQTPVRGGYVPTVTFGGVPLKYKGSVDQNNSDYGGQAVFAGNISSLGAATSTVLVTGMQAGKPFTGRVTSYTYTGAKSSGTLATSAGAAATASLSVPSAKTDDVVFGAVSMGSSVALTSPSFTARQNLSGSDNFSTIAGDMAGDPSVTVSAIPSGGTGWCVVGLNLYTEPVVEFNACTYVSVNWGDTVAVSHTAPAGALILVDVTSGGGGAAVLPPTYGGVPMTLVGSVGWTSRYKYVDTAGGTKTASYSIPTFGAGSMVVRSYLNVGDVVFTTASGAGQAVSRSVVLSDGEMASAVFGAKNGSASGANFTGPTGGTVNANFQDGNRVGMLAMTSDSSTTFAATGNPSYYSGWDSIISVLKLAAPPARPQFLNIATGYNGPANAGVTWTDDSPLGSYLLVIVANNGATGPSGVTYDGEPMTLIYQGAASTFPGAIYEKYNISGGPKTVVVSHAGGAGASVRATSAAYSGVKGRSPIVNSGSVFGLPSVSVSGTGEKGLAVGFMWGADQAFTPSGGTARFNELNAAASVRSVLSDSADDVTFTGTGANRWNISLGFVLRSIPVTAPVFDSASAGVRVANINTATALEWNQSVAFANSDVYVGLVCSGNFPTAARCDGVLMTQLDTIGLNNVNANGNLRIYRITGIDAGVHVMTAGPSGANFMTVGAVSAAYAEAGPVIGASVTSFGTDTTPPAALSQSVTPAAGQRILHVFGIKTTTAAASAYITSPSGGNNRAVQSADAGFLVALSISDTDVAATFTGNGNASAGTVHWAGMAIPMNY